MRRVALEDAVGLPLGHDITEVNVAEGRKFPAFRRGHIVAEEDLEHLRRLGKNAVFIWDDGGDAVHEDDAALRVAPLAAGENITFDNAPSEGKIAFYAKCRGVFQVDTERLYRINSLEIPSFPTIHSNVAVAAGQQVAAFRIIPLTCERSIIEEVCAILREPLLRVASFTMRKAGIIVTGNEVYEGKIEDAFVPKLAGIVGAFDVEVVDTAILPDVREQIAAAVERFAGSCDIVFVTGGTSVDPDDVAVQALCDAGVRYEVKGNPLQPGNNFTVGYKGDVAVCAVPAAALLYKATALDVFLPRILAGQKIAKEDFYRAGHGGLCQFCPKCHFPNCTFGATA